MFWILAKAEGSDAADSNLTFVLIALMTAAAVGLLAVIPVTAARRRRLGRIEGITAIMIIWALITAGGIVYFANAQMKYSKEYTMRLMQMYSTDQSDAPKKPWEMWGCLAAIYGGAILWSTTAKSAAARGFAVDPKMPREDEAN